MYVCMYIHISISLSPIDKFSTCSHLLFLCCSFQFQSACSERGTQSLILSKVPAATLHPFQCNCPIYVVGNSTETADTYNVLIHQARLSRL